MKKSSTPLLTWEGLAYCLPWSSNCKVCWDNCAGPGSPIPVSFLSHFSILLNCCLPCEPNFLCTFFFFFFYLLVACKFGIIPTLVVFTLFPEEQLHPLRSGRTLHSSPSRHGCMWHHHFCSTIEATTEENNHICMFTEWTY